jgi:hypothetical protein
MSTKLQECLDWYTSSKVEISPDEVSDTRDVFQTRLNRLYNDLLSLNFDSENSALLSAVIGEIGNNCFDHNLGQWQDVSGCWLSKNVNENVCQVIIADRGAGIRKTLSRVDSSIQDDASALKVAFERVISGRFPEKRGNGLKFVRNIIHNNRNRGLYCRSGNGSIVFGGFKLATEVEKLAESKLGNGVLTIIKWKME